MCWIRPRLGRVAAGWLVFQFALFVSVPTTLCAMNVANAIAAECTCDHADGQTCPMHHTRTQSQTAASSDSCTCRSTSDPMSAVAAALSGPPAVLGTAVPSVASLDASPYLSAAASQPPAWISVPTSPPPRA